MKNFAINSIAILALLLAMQSCMKDSCTNSQVYESQEVIWRPLSEIRVNIQGQQPKAMQNPTQIYVYGQYLLVGEQGEGIHVINNANPSSPQKAAFIPVKGNNNFAVRNNIILADNYMDLVSIDISDLNNIRLVNRLENVFRVNMIDPDRGFGQYVPTMVTWTYPCQSDVRFTMDAGGGGMVPMGANAASASSSSSRSVNGVAGSMSAFTVNDHYLYAINNGQSNTIAIVDISNPAAPTSEGEFSVSQWGIETLYTTGGRLFIGSTRGMAIYDLSNPTNPSFLADHDHFEGCDPVVVEGNRAYVTVHSGNRCGQNGNVLLILDITDVTNPVLLKQYEMHRPMGLAVANQKLFLCEDEMGLKVFDVADDQNIQLLRHIEGFKAFDVINLQANHLIVTGADGIHQFSYTDAANPNRLSIINQ